MADPSYYISAGLQVRKDQSSPDTGDPTYRIAAGLPPVVEAAPSPAAPSNVPAVWWYHHQQALRRSM